MYVQISQGFVTKLPLFLGSHYAESSDEKLYLLVVFGPSLMKLFLGPPLTRVVNSEIKMGL